jgi:hypothetical protein
LLLTKGYPLRTRVTDFCLPGIGGMACRYSAPRSVDRETFLNGQPPTVVEPGMKRS